MEQLSLTTCAHWYIFMYIHTYTYYIHVYFHAPTHTHIYNIVALTDMHTCTPTHACARTCTWLTVGWVMLCDYPDQLWPLNDAQYIYDIKWQIMYILKWALHAHTHHYILASVLNIHVSTPHPHFSCHDLGSSHDIQRVMFASVTPNSLASSPRSTCNSPSVLFKQVAQTISTSSLDGSRMKLGSTTVSVTVAIATSLSW